MLSYFLIICATEFLIVNYGSHAAGIISIATTTTATNGTETTAGPMNSNTTNKTTKSATTTTTVKTNDAALGNVLGIIKGQKLSTAESTTHTTYKATPSNSRIRATTRAAETALSTLTREERTLRRLFPLLRNATANTDAPGLLGANGLLPLLLTNLLSNDNVGVIAASLISALRGGATTPAATASSAATATSSVPNVTNNYYSTSSYPYYYAGYKYYAPYGYYYG